MDLSVAPMDKLLRAEVRRLRSALEAIVMRWKNPGPPPEGETPLDTAIAQRDELYAIASSALYTCEHGIPRRFCTAFHETKDPDREEKTGVSDERANSPDPTHPSLR